jgi:hypothetical protein
VKELQTNQEKSERKKKRKEARKDATASQGIYLGQLALHLSRITPNK